MKVDFVEYEPKEDSDPENPKLRKTYHSNVSKKVNSHFTGVLRPDHN